MSVKITIITVTYNLIQNHREHTFRQCVESIHLERTSDNRPGEVFLRLFRLGERTAEERNYIQFMGRRAGRRRTCPRR